MNSHVEENIPRNFVTLSLDRHSDHILVILFYSGFWIRLLLCSNEKFPSFNRSIEGHPRRILILSIVIQFKDLRNSLNALCVLSG